jgi:hypothetical protein
MRNKFSLVHVLTALMIIGIIGVYFLQEQTDSAFEKIAREVEAAGVEAKTASQKSRIPSQEIPPEQEEIHDENKPEEKPEEANATNTPNESDSIPPEWQDVKFNGENYKIQSQLRARPTKNLTEEEKLVVKSTMGSFSILEASQVTTFDKNHLVVLREDEHHYGVVTGTIQLMKINAEEKASIEVKDIIWVKSYPQINAYLIKPKLDKDLLKLYHELSQDHPRKVELEIQESHRGVR